MSIKKNPLMITTVNPSIKSLSSQQVPLIPLQLYRTHKHICERCGKRCHIVYEIRKTDCSCEQTYTLKK
jgi:hypothetical protein